jgi:oxygen-independent coproporphyrinogen-3 oxidase
VQRPARGSLGVPPERARTLAPPEGTPLYVHFPFCVSKCTYCDFFSLPSEGHDLAGALEALLAEARARAPRAPRTVFLGGGTPTLHTASELARFLDELDRATGFRSSALEVTVECNPESLDLEKAQALREHGVDRLSIGVQSLRPEILRLFERPHGPEQGLEALRTARAAGFARVNADLIQAVPGSRLEDWEHDLETVLAEGPDHISAYVLAFEEGTAFSRWREEGSLLPLDEELELDFFWATRARLSAAGLAAYEISNFAAPADQCRHNVNYWRNGAYLGIGPSAVSKLDRTRFGNPRSLGLWRKRAIERELPAEWEETLDPRSSLTETWWLGLRLAEGVVPEQARRVARFAVSSDPAEELARSLAADGWLERVDDAYRLSPRGIPLADALAERFLALSSHDQPAPLER